MDTPPYFFCINIHAAKTSKRLLLRAKTQRAASPYVCCCVGLHLLERRATQRAAFWVAEASVLPGLNKCIFIHHIIH